MNIVGVNLGKTISNKLLKDGGLAYLSNDMATPTFLSEERISGVKHKGGFEESAEFLFKQKSFDRPDYVFYSSCCESLRKTKPDEISNIFECEAHPVWHHDSHACLAYVTSGFSDSLIIVMDGGGNCLVDHENAADRWWEFSREQFTTYLATPNEIRMIGRDFDKPFAIGMGEFWRYITYLTGFLSSSSAAKVMELAAVSKRISDEKVFQFKDDRLFTPFKNEPFLQKQKGIEIFENTTGLEFQEFRKDIDYLGSIANWAQWNLEQAVITKLRFLQKKTRMKNLCLAGGVALNCKMVQAIRASNIFENIHVNYAPSDKGQPLGNLVYGMKKIRAKNLSKTQWHNPYMGVREHSTISDINEFLQYGHDQYLVSSDTNRSKILTLLKKGAIICTSVEPSEVGARALGNRSILADPFKSGIKNKLNQIKNRPDYNPVAPVVTKEYFYRFFSDKTNKMPYMAELVYPEKEQEVPDSCKHIDGSTRPQTITENKDSFLWNLASESNDIIPKDEFILLNTSFNGSGHPITETPKQAIEEFRELNLDVLVLTSHTVRRKNAHFEFWWDSASDNRDECVMRIPELLGGLSELQEKYGKIELRKNFSLFRNYIDWMEEGRKITTVRYFPGGITIPFQDKLPLKMTRDFRTPPKSTDTKTVEVHGVKIKKFRDLNITDAQRDGFHKTSHLKQTLRSIYPEIADNSYVTINFIEIIGS